MIIVVVAYLLGSIPFGYLIVRLRAGADVRETGSGGTGATNVSRRAGKLAGVLTLVLDVAKGAAAVLLASRLLTPDYGPNWFIAGAAVATILGHCFPPWLGFRGGKGVATGIGAFLVLTPLAVVAVGILFMIIVWRTRYISLGSITAAAALPLFILLQHFFFKPVADFQSVFFAALGAAALIIFMHRENIVRLRAGREIKFH